MNRSTYWAYTGVMLIFMFCVGFFSPPNANLVMFDTLGIVYMWIVGAMRMNDTKHSQAWAIFAPFLIGTIVIGCLKSAPKTEEVTA